MTRSNGRVDKIDESKLIRSESLHVETEHKLKSKDMKIKVQMT